MKRVAVGTSGCAKTVVRRTDDAVGTINDAWQTTGLGAERVMENAVSTLNGLTV